MEWFNILLARLRAVFRRESILRDIDEEFRIHVEMETEGNIRRGMPLDEARTAAMKSFGDPSRKTELGYDIRGAGWLEPLWQNLRFGIRILLKQPSFSLTTVLMLSLGIGANAAIFTLLHAVMMKNLPVADPESLVRIGDGMSSGVGISTPDDGKYSLFPTAAWRLMKEQTPEFEELAAIQSGFEGRPITARRDRGNAEARSATGEFVSGNYFKTFGLRPQAGRLLTNSDDFAGAPMVAVMMLPMKSGMTKMPRRGNTAPPRMAPTRPTARLTSRPPRPPRMTCASQPAINPTMIHAMIPMASPCYAAFGGRRLLGVEFEIFTSSSLMSTPTSPNNGVDR